MDNNQIDFVRLLRWIQPNTVLFLWNLRVSLCWHMWPSKNREVSNLCCQWKQTVFPQLLILSDHQAQILNHINHPLAQSAPCFSNKFSFVALFTHSSPAMFIQMQFHVLHGVVRSPTPKPKMCRWSKTLASAESLVLFGLFFSFVCGDTG